MNILFVFTLGSEVRQFIHSGIISSLIDCEHQVFVSAKNVKGLVDEILRCEERINLIEYYEVTPGKSLFTYYRELLNRVFEKDLDTWKYTTIKRRKSNFFLEFIIGIINRLNTYKLLKQFEDFLFKIKKSDAWEELLKQYKIKRIVVNVPNNALLPLIAAYKLKIERLLLYHTNKDISAQGRFIVDFSKIGLWSEDMKEAFLKKYGACKLTTLKIIGNSHFSYLDNKTFLLSDSSFHERFGLTDNTCIILYTAAAPWVIKNEQVYVDLIQNALKELSFPKYKIIVRVNPMDYSDSWDKVASDNVIIKHPKWFWDKAQNLNFTLWEDLEEFYSILYYSRCCVNVPSSVTVEAAIMRLPIINLCFNLPAIEVLNGGKVKDFWDAPFNQGVIKHKIAYPSFSYEDFKRNLKTILIDQTSYCQEDERERFLKYTLQFPINELKDRSVDFIVS